MELPVNYDKITKYMRRKARLQYVELQGGKCKHCGNDLEGDPIDKVLNSPINLKLFPPGMLNYPVHLHHDHSTGMTIGAVHARCNAWLWQYRRE